VNYMEKGGEIPPIMGQDVVSSVKCGRAFPEEMPGGFFTILTEVTDGVNTVDQGLVSSQVAVSGDPSDRQTYFLFRAGEEVFSELGIWFG